MKKPLPKQKTMDLKIFLFFRTLLFSVLIISFSSYKSYGQVGKVPVTIPDGGFEIDGDVSSNTYSDPGGDWFPGSNYGSVFDSIGKPLDNLTSFLWKDPYSGTDTIFKGGMKVNDYIQDWEWVTSTNVTDAMNINNVMFHYAIDNNDHQWIILNADRAGNNGNSYIDFSFLQNSVTLNPDGTFNFDPSLTESGGSG